MTTEKCPITAFLHCKKCLKSGLAGGNAKISAGLLPDGNLMIWCDRHEIPVSTFTLARPINPAGEQCGVCGKPLGPEHIH